MIKWIKKRVFDFSSPASIGTANAMPVSLIRLEILFDALSQGFQAFTKHSAIHFPVNRNTTKTVNCPVDSDFHLPIIKASTRITDNNNRLDGRSVLCVGGQKQLYHAYQQIIEDAGGQFLHFHGAQEAPLSALHKLLQKSDLVICPLDCVRHEAFRITQRYCAQYRKPCVILDKCRVTTFYNGIKLLKSYL